MDAELEELRLLDAAGFLLDAGLLAEPARLVVDDRVLAPEAPELRATTRPGTVAAGFLRFAVLDGLLLLEPDELRLEDEADAVVRLRAEFLLAVVLGLGLLLEVRDGAWAADSRRASSRVPDPLERGASPGSASAASAPVASLISPSEGKPGWGEAVARAMAASSPGAVFFRPKNGAEGGAPSPR